MNTQRLIPIVGVLTIAGLVSLAVSPLVAQEEDFVAPETPGAPALGFDDTPEGQENSPPEQEKDDEAPVLDEPEEPAERQTFDAMLKGFEKRIEKNRKDIRKLSLLQKEKWKRLDKRLDEDLEEIQDDIAELKKKPEPKKRTESVECGEDKVYIQVPVVGERLQKLDCGEDEPSKSPFKIEYAADYNKGFLIKPLDPKRKKFQMKVNSWIQFRHVGFARDPGKDSWTDSAGVTRPIRNRNAFDIERGRLTFGGFAHDERLTYFLQLDGDTDGREAVDFFDYWFAWKFSDALRVQIGKRKVSASRRWLMGARDSRFADRPMATDFFRPDRTTGIWATGKFDDILFYEMTLGNGYRTSNRNAGEINDRLLFSLTQWWDAAGPFGKSLTDHAISEEPLVRIGHSFTYSRQSGRSGGAPLREGTFVRLGDGTNLTDVGALAAGTQVDDFDLLFYAVDFGWKSNGWSFSSEVYFRWLNDIEGTGVIPINSIAQTGFFVEGGSVLYENVLDWNVRYSEVNGDFGGSSEVGIGLNWYPMKKNYMKVNFDISRFDGSSLNNTASDILVGENGTLFRTQVQVQF